MMTRPFPGPVFPAAALVLLAAILAPVLAVLATMPPSEAITSFDAAGISALHVSLAASLGATAVATLLGVPAGYYLSRLAPGPRALGTFLLALPLAFPPVASGLMLLYLLGNRSPLGAWLAAHGLPVADTLLGVAAAEFFVSGSFVAIASIAAFSGIDRVYEDAARTLGVGEWRIFTRIALPGAAGSVAAGVAFTWLRAIGEYGATSIVAFHPTALPVALYVTLSAQGVREALALCYAFIVLAGAVLGVAWVFRRGVVL